MVNVQNQSALREYVFKVKQILSECNNMCSRFWTC